MTHQWRGGPQVGQSPPAPFATTSKDDWSRFADGLGDSDLSAVEDALRAKGLDVDAIGLWLHQKLEQDDLVDKLGAAWKAAGERPGAAVLLAFYLYRWCFRRWELSIDHVSISRTIDAASKAGEGAGHDDNDERGAVSLMLRTTESLKVCMEAENALNSSCPVAFKNESERSWGW